MKSCRRCGDEKPLTEFAIDRNRPDGKRSECRPCNVQLAREWRAKNRERTQAQARQRKYGLSPERFEEMVAEQCGRCWICGEYPGGKHKKLVVDHCHVSGQIRSLLCHRCNIAIGLLRDDPDIARRAMAYLFKHELSEAA